MAPLWLKIALLVLAAVTAVGWWVLMFWARAMSTTGTERLPRPYHAVGWVLVGAAASLAWWVFS